MSFDRVADIYDATRGLPENVVERIADRVLEATHATAETRFLELGIGTGRIALPFVRRGYQYTGVDIAEAMLAVLRQKAGGTDRLSVLVADVTDLPFPDRSFDVVLSVHVLHLVPDWQEAVAEARRVLRPDGVFIIGYDRHLHGSPAGEIRRQWRVFVEEAGVELRPRFGSEETVEAALIEAGAYIAEYQVARWDRPTVPRELLRLLRERTFSQTWDVPEPVLAEVDERLRVWGEERFGSLDRELPSPMEFIVSVSRFPSS